MKLFLLFFIFFISFHSSAFAQTLVLPNQLPSGTSNVPGYCIVTQEILVPSDDIYICKNVSTFIYTPSQVQSMDYLYSSCWNAYIGNVYAITGFVSGVILKKQITASFSLPSDYETPCVLKSASEGGICTTPLDVNALVRSAFGQRFPLDLFEGFQSPSSALTCPSLTITGQSFQLCYLKDLVASLKYVLLVVFIISSVIAL